MGKSSCESLERGQGGWLVGGECGSLAAQKKVICPYMQTQLTVKSLAVYPTNQENTWCW